MSFDPTETDAESESPGASDTVFTLDEDGNVASWNDSAKRLKGYEVAEIVGRHYSIFYTPDDIEARRPDALLALARRRGRSENEAECVRKDGSRFRANLALITLEGRGGATGFAAITRALLPYGRSRARDAMVERLLTTASHELRTPLHAMLGWLRILSSRDLEAELRKPIEIVKRNAEAQQKIIDDLLDMSWMLGGRLSMVTSTIDFVSVASAAIETMAPAAAARNVSIGLELRGDIPTLKGDRERLQQAILNLLTNAIKFSDDGGRVSVAIGSERGELWLTVTDYGRGIDRGFLPFIFDSFTRADDSAPRRGGGLGIGLSIVRHIVELHGGRVRAESPGLGQGATIGLTLPLLTLSPQVDDTSQ